MRPPNGLRDDSVRNDATRGAKVLVEAVRIGENAAMAILTLEWTGELPEGLRGGAITIGNFDGVHRGHQALVQVAKRAGQPTITVTFDPPPGRLLFPGPARQPLTSLEDRARRLHDAGADHVVVLKTDAGLLSLSPEAFVEDVIVRLLHAKAVVEGADFHFGRGRAGDGAILRTLGKTHGFEFLEISAVKLGGEPVSSSRVRTAITNGEVNVAEELLGRPFSARGTVVAGARRGRTIGFPTANLDGVETLLPKDGVYAVLVEADGRKYSAAANIGPNPTFGESARKVEVHLLDFAGDLYGQSLNVDFIARMRDTRPFGGVQELVEQLEKDVESARNLLDEKALSSEPERQ